MTSTGRCVDQYWFVLHPHEDSKKEDATVHPIRGRTVASSPLSVSPVRDGSKGFLLHFFEVSIGDVVTSSLRGGGTSGRISSTSSVSVAVHLFAGSLEGSLYFS